MLAISALVARLLPPEEAGAYFLAMSLIASAGVLSSMGLHRAVVRLIAESEALGQHGRTRAAVRHVARLGALGSISVALVIASPLGAETLSRVFNTPSLRTVAGLVALMVALRTYSLLRAEMFRGFHDIRASTLLGGVDSSVLTVAGLAALWLFAQEITTLRLVLLASIAASVPGFLAGSLLLWRRTARLVGPGTLSLRVVVDLAWPLFIMSAGQVVISQADLWVVGGNVDADRIAIYAAALRLMHLVAVPLVVVNAVLPPVIAELHAQGKLARMELIIRAAAGAATVPSAALLVLFVFAGGAVMSLVYGPFYADGGSTLAILSVGQFVTVVAGTCGHTLTMTGHERVNMVITLTSGAVMVGAAVLLVRPFGIDGVAWAAAGGLAVTNLLMWAACKRLVGVRTHASFHGSLAAFAEWPRVARSSRGGPDVS